MTEKRFKSENIKFSNFIVDLNSAISKGANITKYKSYDTNTKKKCDELTDLLNRLNDENERLKEQIAELQYSKKMLRATNEDLELGVRRLRKSFENFDNMRVEHIKFLQKRMKKYGISIYYNDEDEE